MRSIATSLVLVSTCSMAAAQRAPEGWETVDAGRADRSPLATSARRMPVDLRIPLSFDRVYRVPGAQTGVRVPGAASGEDLFARISGGLIAVFPRSEYVSTRRGPAAVVPPGTIFYVGGLPKPLPGQASFAAQASPRTPQSDSLTRAGPDRWTPSASESVDLRVAASALTAPLPPTGSQSREVVNAPPHAPGSQSRHASRGATGTSGAGSGPLADDAHRRERVRALLRIAAAAG